MRRREKGGLKEGETNKVGWEKKKMGIKEKRDREEEGQE